MTESYIKKIEKAEELNRIFLASGQYGWCVEHQTELEVDEDGMCCPVAWAKFTDEGDDVQCENAWIELLPSNFLLEMIPVSPGYEIRIRKTNVKGEYMWKVELLKIEKVQASLPNKDHTPYMGIQESLIDETDSFDSPEEALIVMLYFVKYGKDWDKKKLDWIKINA